MESITLRPTSASGNNWSNISRAYDGDSESYATSPMVTSNNHANYRATFNFDTSSLTEEIINSVTLTIRVAVGYINEMKLYADINTADSNRVIDTDTISTRSTTNYTADITNYINNLSSVIVTPAQTKSYDNTMKIYEVWIDVNYGGASSGLQNMYVGGNKINDIYLGSTNISRVYIGDTKVYGN